jgi:hypothetical protein
MAIVAEVAQEFSTVQNMGCCTKMMGFKPGPSVIQYKPRALPLRTLLSQDSYGVKIARFEFLGMAVGCSERIKFEECLIPLTSILNGLLVSGFPQIYCTISCVCLVLIFVLD